MLLVKHLPPLTVRGCGWAACLALIAVSGLAPAQDASAPIAPGDSRVDLPDAVDAPPPAARPRVQPSVNDVATGTALRSLLATDQSIPTENINVTVAGGVATLRGSVPSLFVRDRALELAQSMRGIERVENLLAVAGPSRPDAAILREVTATLANEPTIAAMHLGVGVLDGEVTLSGTVDRWQTQQQVSEMVKGVPGVRGINSRLSFTTTTQPDAQIAAQVKSRLNQDSWLQPGLVRVSVQDGMVTLNGTVGSVFERNRAITDAWVEGVTGVSADALRVDLTARGEMVRPAATETPTDQEIRGALSNAFAYSNRLISFNPEIRVNGGVVTLDGVVDTPEAKREAETIAAGVPGVLSVQNELEVRGENGAGTTTTTAMETPTDTQGTTPTDESETPPLVAAFREAVNKDPELKTYQLSSAASDDGFRVYGIVDSEAKKLRAENLAAALPGVDKVISKIRVSENWQVTEDGLRPSDDQIRQAIEQALAWNPYIDPSELTIGVQNGIVTLEGNVENWRDSTMASRAALLSGAVDVRNNLKVATTATQEAQQIAAEAARAGTVVPMQTQNVNVIPGAVPGVQGTAPAPGAQTAGVPMNGEEGVFDYGNVDIVAVPGGGFGGLLVPGVAGTQEPGTGLNRDISSVQPRNVPVDNSATDDAVANAPGATGVPGAGGSDPNVAAVPGSAGMTAPGSDQVTNKSRTGSTAPNQPPGQTNPVPAPTTPAPAPNKDAGANNTTTTSGSGTSSAPAGGGAKP